MQDECKYSSECPHVSRCEVKTDYLGYASSGCLMIEEEQRARDDWEDMKVEEYLLRKKGIEP